MRENRKAENDGKTDCERVQELFPLVFNGALNDEDMRTVQNHIAICQSCTEMHEAERALFAVAAAYTGTEAPLSEHVDPEVLWQFAIGGSNLTANELESVKRHVAECQLCTDCLAGLRQLSAEPDVLLDREEAPHLIALEKEISGIVRSGRSLAERLIDFLWSPRLGYGLAAATLTLWLVNPRIKPVTEYIPVGTVTVDLHGTIRSPGDSSVITVPTSPCYATVRIYVNPENQHKYDIEIVSSTSGEISKSIRDFDEFDETGYAEVTALADTGSFVLRVHDIIDDDTVVTLNKFDLQLDH
ncbi:MAG: zf-HC2 domain-containing protein [Proteobacteria bacterium]|nr:zf-HC2 domain-containing protein [Pseudomonadota bacterium]